MTRQHDGVRPDGLAVGASHLVVGIGAAVMTGYVLINIMGIRKASPLYQLIAAGGAIWLHYQLDLPVAKRLSAAGL